MKTEDYLTKLELTAACGSQKWCEIEEDRRRKASQLPLLLDKQGKPFWFVLTPAILSLISEIERNRGFLASLKLPKKFLNQLTSETVKKEAYYSSHIEGAVTSLEVALLHLSKKSSHHNYSDESLQMIVNNKEALEYLRAQEPHPFSHEVICKLHQILVRNTHKDRPITVGAYRKGPIYVVDGRGQVVYEGPPASRVAEMMNAYVYWLNESAKHHALIEAAMAHLYFVHVHPFDDGNGRSARALSNLYLMKQGYQFINFLAPSDYFDHHRADYYQAIQNLELHDGDATFFVSYYLTALADQLKKVQLEIQKETRAKDIRALLSQKAQARLSEKQVKALQQMLDHSEVMTTKKYRKLNRCSDETARKDFNELLELGVVKKIGEGRTTGYVLK